jgi:hypothetical protein
MDTKYTYTKRYQAAYGDKIVVVPDQVIDQRAWVNAGNKSFPAIIHSTVNYTRHPNQGKKVRVVIDPEAYGLFSSGTGDMVVKSA